MKTFSKILALVLALVLAASPVTVCAEDAVFIDVGANDWFAQAVSYVQAHGLMNGVSASCFRPGASVTRAMAVVVLFRLSGDLGPDPARSFQTFTDVPSSVYYSDAVEWAVERQITNGTSKTKFSPGKSITREELVTFLYKYYTATRSSAPTVDYGVLTRFSDAAEISVWALRPMAWAIRTGLIHGRSARNVAPRATLTRAELARTLMNFDIFLNSGDHDPSGKLVLRDGAELKLGMSRDALLTAVGQPCDIRPTSFSCHVYIYPDAVDGLLLVGVGSDGSVVRLLAEGSGFSCEGYEAGYRYAKENSPFVTLDPDGRMYIFHASMHTADRDFRFVAAPVGTLLETESYLDLLMVNAYRKLYNLQPLLWSAPMSEAAKRMTRDLLTNGYHGTHVSSDGATPTDRARDAGLERVTVSECLSVAWADPFLAHSALINSSAHRAILLDPSLTHFAACYGVGACGLSASCPVISLTEDFFR